MVYKIKQSEIERARTLFPDIGGSGIFPAVKYIRDVTGCGLREAKDFVESEYRLGVLNGTVWVCSDRYAESLMNEILELTDKLALVRQQLKDLGI
jgi:hypothetical protein